MFKFSLDPVLDYRKVVEETRQRELALVLEAITRIEEEKGGLLKGLDESRDKIRETVLQGQSHAYRQLFESWIGWAEERIKRLEGEMRLKAVEAEKRRRALAEAAKGRTILEKLRDREKKDYQAEIDREEQKMFDEIALREFNSQRRERKERISEAAERNAA